MQHLLVVDDDRALCVTMRMTLEQAGFEVSVARDGNEALRVLAGGSIDLLLCDLYMPDKDGLETIQEVRRGNPRIPIIALSGGGFNGAVDLLPFARRLGAAEVLAKPFTGEALVSTVRSILSRDAETSGS